MKLRVGSLKRETKLTNLQLDSQRKKEGSNKSNKKRKRSYTDTTEIQRITANYYEQQTEKLRTNG